MSSSQKRKKSYQIVWREQILGTTINRWGVCIQDRSGAERGVWRHRGIRGECCGSDVIMVSGESAVGLMSSRHQGRVPCELPLRELPPVPKPCPILEPIPPPPLHSATFLTCALPRPLSAGGTVALRITTSIATFFPIAWDVWWASAGASGPLPALGV